MDWPRKNTNKAVEKINTITTAVVRVEDSPILLTTLTSVVVVSKKKTEATSSMQVLQTQQTIKAVANRIV